MANRSRTRIRLGQNFLNRPALARALLASSSIGPSDIVYEIGPGSGLITAVLARRSKQVVAIELDRRLARQLRARFRDVPNVHIVEGDFLSLRIPDRPYKVFANIPYNATARIMRKLLYERPAPVEAYVVMQKEPARRYAGWPCETLLSVLAKPYFDLRITRHLKRTDFEPVPSVDSVLLSIERRRTPLVRRAEYCSYREFVEFGFSAWKQHLRSAYKRVFTYKQWKRLARELHFPLNATPTELSFEQWLGLYRGFRNRQDGCP